MPASGSLRSIERKETTYSISSQHNNCKLINVLILDWDDTLCPTSHILKQKYPTNCDTLHAFACNLYRFLVRCIQCVGASNLFIVTNGGRYWVQQSLIVFIHKYPSMPEFTLIFNLLQSTSNHNGIRVVSAKHYYRYALAPSRSAKSNGLEWKTFTFQCVFNGYLYFSTHKNLSLRFLSIGDSWDEYHASKKSKKWLQQQYVFCHQTLCHTVKLKSVPSIDEMNQQLSFLSSLVAWFAQHSDSCFDNTEIDINLQDAEQLKQMKKMAMPSNLKQDFRKSYGSSTGLEFRDQNDVIKNNKRQCKPRILFNFQVAFENLLDAESNDDIDSDDNKQSSQKSVNDMNDNNRNWKNKKQRNQSALDVYLLPNDVLTRRMTNRQSAQEQKQQVEQGMDRARTHKKLMHGLLSDYCFIGDEEVREKTRLGRRTSHCGQEDGRARVSNTKKRRSY